jgi:hypothetical protein
MDLLFDITVGKTVIFHAIHTGENCPDLIYQKLLFSFLFFQIPD